MFAPAEHTNRRTSADAIEGGAMLEVLDCQTVTEHANKFTVREIAILSSIGSMVEASL